MIGIEKGVSHTLSGLRPGGTENGHMRAFIARQRSGEALTLSLEERFMLGTGRAPGRGMMVLRGERNSGSFRVR